MPKIQRVKFSHLERNEIEVRFEMQANRVAGGSVPLQDCDSALGLSDALAVGLRDPRQPDKITHTFRERPRQRAFGRGLGSVDGNDAAWLKGDQLLRLLTGREPCERSTCGVPPDAVAIREPSDLVRLGPAGRGAGSSGARASEAAAQDGEADHAGLLSHLRSDASELALESVQCLVRYVLLRAHSGLPELRSRTGALPSGSPAAGEQRVGQADLRMLLRQRLPFMDHEWCRMDGDSFTDRIDEERKES